MFWGKDQLKVNINIYIYIYICILVPVGTHGFCIENDR